MLTFALISETKQTLQTMDTKEFFKWVLAVLCGLLIWGIVKFIMFIMMIGSIASSASSATGSSAPILPKEGVLVMDMSTFALAEQTREDNPFGSIPSLQDGSAVASIGLLDAVNAIHKAAEDPGVKYIYLKTDNAASSLTYLEELRKTLTDFRKSGKPVVVYGEAFTSGSYYLASVADKIYTTSHHGGNDFFLGISGRMIFLKDLLDKLGVNYQLIRHGKYKSAGEMYAKNAPSPENMEQNQAMIDSMWETIEEETASSRDISVDSLNFFIENLTISYPEDMVKHNLADGLLSMEELKDKLASLASKEKYKDDPNNISGNRFSSVIAKVRADSSVKAVVFRVNSPGGTVLSANKIKEQIDLTKAVKPVIASYGNYAASGGYWISSNCDHIFSDATTLTGSIGCFSAIPEFGKTLKDIAHVNITPVKSHKHSDMLSLTRPFDAEETQWMQDYVDDIYTSFVNLVAEGRGKTYESVDSIAQGRVWTGKDALKIGLVDEIGTLEDALRYTASVAGDSDLDNWNVVAYPKPMSFMEQLKQQLGKGNKEEVMVNAFAGTPLEYVAKTLLDWQKTWTKGNGDLVFARMPFEIEVR